jgi:4-carboxymuconolactone decarboxylase
MRLTTLALEDMSADQKAIHDESTAGKRGTFTPPAGAWIHAPELARHANRLGEFVRYNTSLGAKNSELAILVTARHWSAHYEWFVHKKMALQAGLDPKIIDDINARRTPSIGDAKSKLVYDFAKSLHETHQVPEPLYDSAIAMLGEKGTVELVGLLGYYALVSMTLNAFDVSLPDGAVSDLAP